jgi:hypothetical protein
MGRGGARAAGQAVGTAVRLAARAVLAHSAVGATKSFRPGNVKHRSLIFAPRGVRPERSERAYLHGRGARCSKRNA